MNNEEVRILLIKYREGTLTDEERAILESWYLHIVKNAPDKISDEVLRNNLRIVERIVVQGTVPKKNVSSFIWASVAAALLLIAGTGLLFLWEPVNNDTSADTQIGYIAPGTNKATLTLMNGRKVDLNGEKKGIIVKNNKLAYNDGSNVEGIGTTEAEKKDKTEKHRQEYFELRTPRGGQYQIILPDGTKVWLNAASVLRYPSKFEGKAREVELEGEAFFEVSSQSDAGKPLSFKSRRISPFIVKSKGMETIVLGTSFNISSYKEDTYASTTLVNGKVKVVSHAVSGKNEVTLSPGQESLSAGDGLKIREADIPSVIGWKQGIFKFNQLELRSVMNQLSRWYNIEVEYRGTIRETFIYGIINRDSPLADVLNILKEGGVNFRMETREEHKKLLVFPAI